MRPGSLEQRVTALESQVRELADRVRVANRMPAAARVLAGAADRDVWSSLASSRLPKSYNQ